MLQRPPSKRTLQRKRQQLKRASAVISESFTESSAESSCLITTEDTLPNSGILVTCEENVDLNDSLLDLGDQSLNYVHCKEKDDEQDLKSSLSSWAVLCRVKHTTLNMLLGMLKRCAKLDLPKDSRTLLKTPRTNSIIDLKYGTYNHFGIEKGLRETP